MPVFSFKTISQPATGWYKEKGSKFLSFAFSVQNEAEVKAHLDLLRKKYFDARHHCYAYRLGPEGLTVRANDDGEPNHSAGDPILGQIRSRNLTNIVVIVVRYFGGVKLGVGGLIAAYRQAAEDALNHATIIEQEVSRKLILRFDYASLPEVMRLVKECHLDILSQGYDDKSSMEISVPMRLWETVEKRLEKWTALKQPIEYSIQN